MNEIHGNVIIGKVKDCYTAQTDGTNTPENQQKLVRSLKDKGCTSFKFDERYDISNDSFTLCCVGYVLEPTPVNLQP